MGEFFRTKGKMEGGGEYQISRVGRRYGELLLMKQLNKLSEDEAKELGALLEERFRIPQVEFRSDRYKEIRGKRIKEPGRFIQFPRKLIFC